MRIGITQRIVSAPNYDERRDALAQDWHGYMSQVFPQTAWAPVPNIGVGVTDWAEQLGLDAFIFSGGETPGTSPQRDETETSLYEYAQSRKYPVLGICRGLQFFLWHAGQVLAKCDPERHVATRHALTPCGNGTNHPKLPTAVNSFHTLSLERSTPLPNGWQPLATSPDDMIEAISHENGRVIGIMWHPERDPAPEPHTAALIRRLFSAEEPK